MEYVLTMYRDSNCGGARLASTVRSGDLKRSPVWTAFRKSTAISLVGQVYLEAAANFSAVGTHELKKDNLKRKTDHTVIINNADKEICSPGYDEMSQMVGKRAFSLKFQKKFGK